MIPVIRSAFVILTAVAVLLVSATCTAAGCVLGKTGGSSAPGSVPACCSSHHSSGHDSSAARRDAGPLKDGEPCPLCRATLLVGKSVDHSQHSPAALSLLHALFLSSTPASTAHGCSSFRLNPALSGGATPNHPPTLLSLHCALQN